MNTGLYYISGIALMPSESNLSEYMDYDTLLSRILLNGYKFHHTSTRNGYIRSKMKSDKSIQTPCKVSLYSGKFGEGFTVHINKEGSSRYHNVEYFVRDSDLEL